jgi:hypothetical protein
MGSYTHLTVAGYPLFETKSEVVPELMTVFRETDRRMFIRRISDRKVALTDPGGGIPLETIRRVMERVDRQMVDVTPEPAPLPLDHKGH